MPKIYDMGRTALLPLRRKVCWGFFRPKNPTASAGFEPTNLVTKGQPATPRPPFVHNYFRLFCREYNLSPLGTPDFLRSNLYICRIPRLRSYLFSMTSFHNLSLRSGHILKYLLSVVVRTDAFSAMTCVYGLGRIVNVAFDCLAFMLHRLAHVQRWFTSFGTCAEAWVVLLSVDKGKPIPLQAWTGHDCSGRIRRPDFKTIGTWRW